MAERGAGIQLAPGDARSNRGARVVRSSLTGQALLLGAGPAGVTLVALLVWAARRPRRVVRL